MSFSVVILSKSKANLEACVRAVRTSEPSGPRIIVVDDGLDVTAALLMEVACQFVPGEKPFIFARNANIGIRAAGEDDVILLNDDALLMKAEGFTGLAQQSAAHPEFGVIASSTNSAGNPSQMRQTHGLYEDPRMVCFVCVYIPRTTVNAVGLLDERFTGYGCDDDDYCLRVRNAGLKIGIFDGCFVDHLSLKSQFRGHGAGDFRPNLKVFIQKHGVDNWGQARETSQFSDLF